MKINDATIRQHLAADPTKSTWLSANAGSGKTRVLTDRVARLLLDGVRPQHILCLTYTKAAASEMQNRLFQRLGDWAMLDDNDLRQALAELGVDRNLTSESLRQARTLFARAIETPGGLKIQTIHSFCGALLRRFPLEAGVSPQFTEIEDRASDILRAEIVDDMAMGTEAHLVNSFAIHYSGQEFGALTSQIVRFRDAFSRDVDWAKISCKLGYDPTRNVDPASHALREDDVGLIRELIPALRNGGATDSKVADAISGPFNTDAAGLAMLQNGLLTATRTIRKNFPSKKVKTDFPDLVGRLDDLCVRLQTAWNADLARKLVERSTALHAFARAFLQRYEAQKVDRAWLDFDDLIERARALLSDPSVAAWVLFRIDGGVDHILVDEAQDTSPSQWDVIRKLAEEFASGQGSRSDTPRTLFVVGDQKQSIYSFQGADPREFDRMRRAFDERLSLVSDGLQQTSLDHSFRSSPVILNLVDRVFAGPSGDGFSQPSHHIAFHDRMPGRVDLWPIVEPSKADDDTAWYDPVDRRGALHHHRRLALRIAADIKEMLDKPTLLPTDVSDGTVLGRQVEPRDFLILVRRRSPLFHEIIRACKEADLPVAGSDRLRVGAEVAVKDLAALLSFLDTPEDDLALATVLRSPLFGWSEAELYDLAHNRGDKLLWEALRNLTETHPVTIGVLRDLRDKVDFLRPFDLLERILTRHDGRKKLLGRLGPEAQDGIDALLTQALAYERNSVPSLTGFLVWMETDDLEIKRQIDAASNQIRIMTIHGSKGLEAPIVILPDCGPHRAQDKSEIFIFDQTPILRPNKEDQPQAIQVAMNEANDLRDQEAMRLLYVALTRAEKWLIVAASGASSKDGSDWYQKIETAIDQLKPQMLDAPFGQVKRLETGDWSAIQTVAREDRVKDIAELERFFERPPPPIPPATPPISPSDLGGSKTVPGEGLDDATAKAYGTYVHKLLELSPGKSVPAPNALGTEMVRQAEQEAETVRNHPGCAFIFDRPALSEVAVTAPFGDRRMSGVIDRLIVHDERVLAVDFKTNRTVPNKANQTPEGILRQMGAYQRALSLIYPDRRIETAILWTADARLMRLPHDIVMKAFESTRYLDAPKDGS